MAAVPLAASAAGGGALRCVACVAAGAGGGAGRGGGAAAGGGGAGIAAVPRSGRRRCGRGGGPEAAAQAGVAEVARQPAARDAAGEVGGGSGRRGAQRRWRCLRRRCWLSVPVSSPALACAITSGAVCACDEEAANCIAVSAVVASNTRRRFVMMVWVPGKFAGNNAVLVRKTQSRHSDQQTSVRPECGAFRRRILFLFMNK